MVGGLHGQSSKPTILCVCMLMWATRGCAGLYFYAYDYSSWLNTVMIFRNTSILRDGGVLQMNPYTNTTIGRALYKTTFQMQNSTNGSLASFNTSFVFNMNTDRANEFFGDGFAFLICPNPFRGPDLQVSAGGYLGMFNSSTTGQLSNKIFAVEFDTHLNVPFNDPNDNHIGVDVNSVISLKTNDLTSLGITLNGGRKIVCWIDYDGIKRYLWVYLAYSPSGKPSSPAISMNLDLAPYMKDYMYVGFSSATGTRAELHTIYSWWFLSGFGNLTLTLSPPSSRRPLASLGKRSIVVTIFTLAVALGFLGCFCVLARRRWQEQSKHLIDIFLPVACWMYWKESITEEVRSTYCLKLATPTMELLAWLWRTRWARRHDQPEVKTWREMLRKCKMTSWENKRQKRCKLHNALHVIVEEYSSGDEADRVKVIKHIKVMPVPDMEVKEAAEMEEEAPTPLIVAATGQSYKVENNSFMIVEEESKAKLFQRRGSFSIPQRAPDDNRDHELEMEEATKMEQEAPTPLIVAATGESYKVENDSFMIVEEENKAKLFQRRGSFSIPQRAPDDNREHEIEPAKEKDATGPVVAPPQAHTSKVKVGAVPRHSRLEPKTLTKEKLFQRRGLFGVHPEDAIELTVGQAPVEGKDPQPPMEYLVEHDAETSSGKAFDARRGSFSVLPEDAMEFTGMQVSTEGKAQQSVVRYTVEQDIKNSSSKGFDQRRGSFSVHPEDANEFSAVQAAKEGKGEKSGVRYIVEDDAKGRSGKGFDARRGSFSVHPEDAMEFTGRQASKEGKNEQHRAEYIVEHDAMSISGEGLEARKGSFMLVEEAGSSSTSRPGPSDQTLQSSDHATSDQPPKSLPHHTSNTYEDGKSHVTHLWLFD